MEALAVSVFPPLALPFVYQAFAQRVVPPTAFHEIPPHAQPRDALLDSTSLRIYKNICIRIIKTSLKKRAESHRWADFIMGLYIKSSMIKAKPCHFS
jgi:hypothetical protein